MNEYLEFKKLLEEIKSSGLKPTLLLHSCCGPCSSYVLKMLCDYFKVTIYYYNPNIYPMEEFNKRKNVQIELINKMDLDIDKKKIQLKDSIKTLGTHEVPVKLHPKVTSELKVIVREA